jgi:CRISPR-associated protein Cmr1
MNRNLPKEWTDEQGSTKAPPALSVKTNERITQMREYELITPLFGGGVDPCEADPVTIVRASEVRGQLRFWWRATRGGQFGDVQALKKAEDLLWGSTTQQSLVEIEVIVDREAQWYPLIPEHRNPKFPPLDMQGNPIPSTRMTDPTTAWQLRGQSKFRDWNRQLRTLRGVGDPASRDSYVAFALKDRSGLLLEGVRFGLHIALPDEWPKGGVISFVGTPVQEVAAALWAWETFGGVGARTRRGCGAIRRIDASPVHQILDTPLPDQPNTIEAWMTKWTGTHIRTVSGTNLADVPCLTQTPEFALARVHSRGLDAWRELSDSLRRFRQQRPSNGQGRNRWPEPNAVRRLSGTYYVDPANPAHNHNPGSGSQTFPRAAFGLPINFQFKADQVYVDPRANPLTLLPDPDPPSTNTLTGDGKDYERYTSPLILRPIACANNQYRGLALLLDNTRLPPTLKLTTGTGAATVVATMSASDAARIGLRDSENQPLTFIASGGVVTARDVLRTFLEYVKGL